MKTEHVHHGTRVHLVRGDITTTQVDAIVNAANSQLAGGGGVDGAIHRAGGPSILEACQAWVAENGPLEAGRAMTTPAGDLPASHVIHAVGPKWVDGQRGEYVKLERAYASSLDEALAVEARTVAFPSISTGAYRFPIDRAAYVALNTTFRFIGEHEGALDEVRFVLFSDADLEAWAKAFDEVSTTMLG